MNPVSVPDSYYTLAGPSTGEYKDRGSRFIAYACPASSETAAVAYVEQLRKEHFKARHHCFAWRIGVEGLRFRANDDGEPGGTAGRPILGQIDAAGLTDVVVVVVRYFGGTLLGASGLIQAYREAAAEAIRAAEIVEKLIQDKIALTFDYALMPEIMHALKKLEIEILEQEFQERGLLRIAIRKSETTAQLLKLKSQILKTTGEEATTLDWPTGMNVEIEE